MEDQALMEALSRPQEPPRWHQAPVLTAVIVVHLGIGWALSRLDMRMDVTSDIAPLYVHLIPATAATETLPVTPAAPAAPAPPAPSPAPPPPPPPPAPPPPPPPAPEPPPIMAAELPVPQPPSEFKVPPPPPPKSPPKPKPQPRTRPRAAPAPPRPAPPAPATPSQPTPAAQTEPSPSETAAPTHTQPVPPAQSSQPQPAPLAPPQAPKTVPATAVQYLERPAPVYPAFSRRTGETGRVTVRVLIDAKGNPSKLELQRSSGFARLDDSAITAVRTARFKPYTEDGVARPVWVLIPIVFDLER